MQEAAGLRGWGTRAEVRVLGCELGKLLLPLLGLSASSSKPGEEPCSLLLPSGVCPASLLAEPSSLKLAEGRHNLQSQAGKGTLGTSRR